MNYQIISDGACDLQKDFTESNHITIVPFYVTFDGVKYMKEGEGISHDDFYLKMINEHAIPKSSLPSIQDYVNVFGYTYFVVASGSMSGTIEVDDIIFVKITTIYTYIIHI